jgi:PAS domain S-box-containing protein
LGIENENMGKTTERQKIVAVSVLFLPFIFLLGSLLLSASAWASGPTKPKNVLVLFSAAQGQPLFDIMLSEVRTTIQRGYGGPLNFFVEYLEMERFPDKQHLRTQIDFIRETYTREKMDLLISIGPDIIPLISKYLRPVFDDVPTVFIRFRSGYPDDLPIDRKPNMTGLIVEVNPKKTFETALSLHPATTEAFVITGSAPADRVLESIARIGLREYEDRVKVTYLSDLAMEELLQSIARLPKNSIVIYLSYQKDANGVNYYAIESLKLLSEATSAPIYGIWEQFVGNGIVGGYVIGVNANASKVGQIALRIFQGEDPDKIPVERGSMFYVFDWKEMKRWGIKERNLPEGSIIINKEVTFWEAFRWYIIGTILFVVIETLLVIFLVALYRRQKGVEKQLHEAAKEWQTTFDSIQDLIFILDRDLKVVRVNAPTLAFLNLPAERVLGSHCYTLMHGTNEPPEKCMIPTMTRTKRHEDTEVYDQKRNVWFHISVAPILDDKGEIEGIVHQVRDITEQKKTDAEIQLARAELLRVERSFRMSELTASLAHELNQPLAAILSNAQAALHFLDSDKADLNEFREILRDIIQDDKRAGNVIRSLRSMMKREEGEKKPIILSEVLNDVIAILHSEAVFRNVHIETDFGGSFPAVLADRIQLQQVTLNLVMNAAEAMALNLPEERRIILRTEATDNCIRVSVRDFGPGIDKENLERLFQPFFTTKGSGLGMGLAICKSIIEVHGGRIWAENNPDGGATFVFELPVISKQ